MKQLHLYAKFEKIDQAARMVYGYASTEALDSHGEIVKRDAVAAALPDFMRWGNIREMHQPSAVGKAKEAAMDEHGLWLGAKIVDDDAWEKVKEGVYSGFSIAGQVTARDGDQPNVITGCHLSEISLVDRPANPEAVFTMFKAATPLAKEGRRNSAEDQAGIQAIHDRSVELGAACPDCSSDSAQIDMPDMALARLEDRLAALNIRLQALEIAPAPAKGSLKAIAKAADLGPPAPVPAGVHELIKASLQRPMVC